MLPARLVPAARTKSSSALAPSMFSKLLKLTLATVFTMVSVLVPLAQLAAADSATSDGAAVSSLTVRASTTTTM